MLKEKTKQKIRNSRSNNKVQTVNCKSNLVGTFENEASNLFTNQDILFFRKLLTLVLGVH